MSGFDDKVVIEVRCNEYTMRDRNKHVPWSPDEIAADAAACREAGASIVHFHARDPETGAVRNDTATYAEVIRAVRAGCDVLLNPTLGASTIPDPMQRVAHIPELAQDPATRPELAPVDLGSFNVDPFDWDTLAFRAEEIVYRTSVAGLRHEIDAITTAGVGVQSVLWTVGSARCLGAFLAMGVLTAPAFAQVTLSDVMLSTHPGTVHGMQALVEFLPRTHEVHWAVSCFGGNLLRLVSAAVDAGGHVSIGLGDYPYRELGEPTNAEVVAEAVRMLRAMGREPATPDEVRDVLGLGR
ncbi:MAG TPA: 3-keto-5-aminohexanoate cleavage protein [Acidimicrobiales bacterium]